MAELSLFAQPYDPGAGGFFFSSLEEYEAKSKKCRNDCGFLVEEFEIGMIDGEAWAVELYDPQAMRLDQWFQLQEKIEDEGYLAEEQLAAKIYGLMNNGETLEHILDMDLDSVIVSQCSSVEYWEEYAENMGLLSSLPDEVKWYFDLEAWGRDMQINGAYSEFQFCGKPYMMETDY